MMSRANWLILGLAVLAALAGGWLQHVAHTHHGGRLVGQRVPALTLRDLDGRPHALREYAAGRRVLLNLWAPWCGPCRREMPALSEAQRRYAHGAPVVIGIAMDDPDAVRSYLAAHPVAYPSLLGQLDDPDTSRRLGDDAGVLPYSLLLDPDGTVRATHRGRLGPALLRTWLDTGR